MVISTGENSHTTIEENLMVSMSKPKQVLGLIGWLVLSFAASAVGAAASIQAQSFYGQLVQPSWAPPPWVFGPVWTVLFSLMAIAAWLVWRCGGIRRHHSAMGPHCCHPALLLACSPAGRRAPRSVPVMGQFCSRPELHSVAAQSSDSGLAN